jgi:hypothetical protein
VIAESPAKALSVSVLILLRIGEVEEAAYLDPNLCEEFQAFRGCALEEMELRE